MPDVFVTIEGARRVAAKFEAFPPGVLEALKPVIAEKIGELGTRIEAIVPRATGKLASEIRTSVRSGKDYVSGSVRVTAEFAKAGALEYGAHRQTKVKEHQMRLDHRWSRAMQPPELVSVPTHTRTPDIAEQRFMRGPLEEMRAAIEAAIDEAVASATAEADKT